MSNIVTWLKPATQVEAVHLSKRIGAFVKLCQGGFMWNWGPVYQNSEENPTQFAVEHNTTLMDAELHPYAALKWTAAATVENTPPYFLPGDTEHANPQHVVAAIGDPLFTPEELEQITIMDIEGWFEFYVP